MASDSNKKLTILYILKVLQDYSDEQHPLTQAEIANKVYALYGVKCERKSISYNIDCLIEFDYDIIKTKQGCFLGQREFEPSEISFLIDAIFSSKSITSRNSKELANKLSAFLSLNQRKKYKYIYKSDEIARTNNKQLFYVIDTINQAIDEKKKIAFTYNKYKSKKEITPRKDGKQYIVNPYFMVNNLGKYYLVCNFDYFDTLANYKVEMITDIRILDEPLKPIEKLKGYEKGINISNYINDNIYMISSETIKAKLKLLNEWSINYIIDWFGTTPTITEKDNCYYAELKANKKALIYWCLQYGEDVELIEPISVREEIKKTLKVLTDKYKI